MPAGSRRHRITIQQSPKPWTQDNSGDPVPSFTEYGKWWASRREPRASERPIGQQTVAHVEYVYGIPHDSQTREISADESWRLVHGDRAYDIVSAEPDDRRSEMKLIVRGRAEVAA